PRFPKLPNAPFRIDAPPVSLSADQVLLNPIHAYYHSIEQINGGRNDMFAAMSTVGGYTMGYFDGSGLKLWQWAKEFTLADNFLKGRFRRPLSHPSVPGRRAHARLQGRAAADAGPPRCQRQAREEAGLAIGTRRGGRDLLGRIGRASHAGWLRRQ